MQRRRWLFLAAVSLMPLPVRAQAAAPAPAPAAASAPAAAKLAFDVATIRRNDTGSHSWSIDSDEGYFNGTNMSLKSLLESAYQIRASLITGGPDWMDSARYDVHAKSVEADQAALRSVTDEQQHAMLRALLIDRFHLVTHVEVRQLAVYDLVVAKSGPKLQTATHPAGEDVFHNVHPGGTSTHNGHLTAHAISMRQFEKFIAGQVDRTVIDRTGLTGEYDVLLDFAPDYGNGPSPEATEPAIFTALPQQLGLKLEPAKGPVNTLVIDHIEQPTAN